MRDLRQKTKSGLAESQTQGGKIQPDNKKKTTPQFAVGTIAEWQAGLCLRQMYQSIVQDKVIFAIYCGV